MKQTKEDRAYARRFSEALQPHVSLERTQGKSLEKIAARLGITAAGLQKQLAGGTPSIRTIAFAYAIYGVAVPYEGINFAGVISRNRKGKRGRVASEGQLFLPFEITASPTAKRLSFKLVPKSPRRYQLQIIVAASA
jgi:transcriptional regulator with XRE-family HTH domain